MARPVNTATKDLVKHFEGLRLRAYLCPAGIPTIGYGHTGGVTLGDTITAEEAEELLEHDLHEAVTHVDRLIRVELNENQRGCLASFVLNLGATAFMSSTLRQRLNAGDYDAVPAQIRRWNKARHPTTGDLIVLPGLERRREAEVALWLTPVGA
jgi:lysozyme